MFPAGCSPRVWSVVLGCWVLGCGGDEGGGPSVGTVDAGAMDASAQKDASGQELRFDAAALAAFPCRSWTAASEPYCGGAACRQTLEFVRTTRKARGACQSEQELLDYCSIRTASLVETCTVQSVTAGVDLAACARAALPSHSQACVDCYVESAACAVRECLTKCVNAQADSCDECRVEKGCASDFFACAGFEDPLL